MPQDPPIFSMTTEIGFTYVTSMVEDGYSITKGANFTENHVLARSSPIITYADSSSMTFDVTLPLWSLYGPGGAPGLGGIGGPSSGGADHDINDAIKAFMALTFPVQPGIQPPCLCTINFANLLKNWTCVLKNAAAHIGSKRIWTESGTSYEATMNCNFVGIETQNVPASTWFTGGGGDFSYLAF